MASTNLTRTFTAGNRKTFTISTWFKLATPDIATNDYENIIAASGGDHGIWIRDDNKLDTYWTTQLVSTNVLKDTSGWCHVVAEIDTTQATDTNRVKIYLNGEQVSLTDASGGAAVYPTQNADTLFNDNGGTCSIGRRASTSVHYWNGSMAHFHFIDGTAYDASYFGETDTTTGIWKPKVAPSVTYGTNGFFLKFENSGSMGTDSSGNANNFTVNGTLTQTVDTPSNVFCTLNSLDNFYCAGTFSNGNNTIVTGSSEYSYVRGTLGVSQGKWYYEAKAVATSSGNTWYSIGWSGNSPNGTTAPLGNQSDAVAYQGQNGTIRINTAETSTGTTFTTGDIIGTALDLDNNLVYFYKNGTLVNSGGTSITASASTTNGIWCPAVGDFDSTGTKTWSTNFGNGYFGTTAVASAGTSTSGDASIWEYDCPSGYYGLNTKNINRQEYS